MKKLTKELLGLAGLITLGTLLDKEEQERKDLEAELESYRSKELNSDPLEDEWGDTYTQEDWENEEWD